VWIVGHTYTKAKVFNPNRLSKFVEVELMVDTGSRYTWISKDTLETLDLRPEKTAKFRTIDGRVLERHTGIAIIECADERTGTTVVFGEKNDVQVLGVHSLEGLRLEIDPYTGELKPIPVILAV